MTHATRGRDGRQEGCERGYRIMGSENVIILSGPSFMIYNYAERLVVSGKSITFAGRL